MPSPPRQGNRRPDVRVRAPREVLARLRRGVAKPQVKLLIGVSDPCTEPSGPPGAVPWTPGRSLVFLPGFLLGIFAGSVVLTWMYESARSSILAWRCGTSA
jgi:hypothetical protein